MRLVTRSTAPAACLAAAALVVLVAPGPGASLSVVTTRALASLGLAVPGVVHVSDGFLLALALGTAASLLATWHRAPERRIIAAAAAVGVVLAYVASEGAKVLLAQPRPCTLWPSAGECHATDFSLPSNHATLAFGAVWVIAIATQRVSAAAVALVGALVVAAGRMLEGAHYLHDVAAGALLGVAVPLLLSALAIAWSRRRLSPVDP